MEVPRKVFFKNRAEKTVMGGLLCLVFSVYLFELFVILPKLHGPGFSSSSKLGHMFLGTLILINTLYSVWKFVSTDPGSGSVVLPSALQPGWRYCWRCEANFPPRSFHCYTCDKCALVRDHHCIIGSNCVGYTTRRYFLHMNSYLWLALAYANYLHFDFVFELFHSFSAHSVLTMVMPLLAWMLGIAEGETFLMALMTSLCIVSLLYATAILLFHLRNTLKGRTTPEVMKNTGTGYNLGIAANLREAFGINWKVAWISPFIPSPLPGDGMTFVEKDLAEQNGKSL